jgi:predicted dehydrogenase
MKQVTQSYKTGELRVVDLPEPQCPAGGILVRTAFSLISAGTERSIVSLARESLIGKARARPDLVRKVIDRVKRDGLLSAMDTVKIKLDTPIPLGYSCAGVVEQAGAQAGPFRAGDRVACAGAGFANHAELNAVPANLVARIPDGVPLDAAACATVAAIALQGVRIASPSLGEKVAVIGLGLLGQLAISILKANGCQVLAIDLDAAKVQKALERGAEMGSIRNSDNTVGDAIRFSGGHGMDAVLITAGTQSNDPLLLAGELCRDKGRVSVVGDVPCSFPRKDYYEKELSLLLSRSYGPGRYNAAYEEQGLDFPIGYVRWTENRNLDCVLGLMARGLLPVSDLISARFPIARAEDAYQRLLDPEGKKSLGILLEYPSEPQRGPVVLKTAPPERTSREIRLGFIGAGSFGGGTLMPHFAAAQGVRLLTVASARGLSARHTAEKYGFEVVAGSSDEILADPKIDAVVIATRHDSHAALATAALRANKHVFVEKPLALDEDGLKQVVDAARESGKLLFVGFNRRFSPLARELKKFLPASQPLQMMYRVNAGTLPQNSWIRNPEVGGGRIIGEACHFIDFMSNLCGAPPIEAACTGIGVGTVDALFDSSENFSASIRFADGSVGTLVYTSMGDGACGKEYFEVYAGGKMAILRDFRSLEKISGGKIRRTSLSRQDKGFEAEITAFVSSIQGKAPAPFSLEHIAAVTRTTFTMVRALSGSLNQIQMGKS